MQNFEYRSPTRIVFGKGSIAKLSNLVPAGSRVLLAYGKSSAKANGAYAQITAVCKPVAEFSGIEPNPEYETLMKAVACCKENKVDFILAVGGGSVVDGMKFVAAALNWTKSADPYDIITEYGDKGIADFAPNATVPIGAVMTIPATGTETNGFSVVSRRATGHKSSFWSPTVIPVFSIIDPDFILSLPPRQVGNGVVDAFVHVIEQYSCNFEASAVGDEFSEGILRVLSTTGKDVALAAREGRQAPYRARADYWWATTQALSGIISVGVDQCWAIHAIGHEITATYGLDHAQTLALVLPPLLRLEKESRAGKLARMAERVFNVKDAPDMAEEAIVQMERLFNTVGVPTHFSQHGMDAKHFETIASKFEDRIIGAEGNIGKAEVLKILNAAL